MGNTNSKGKYRLLLLGLDAAGKTTVLQKISGKRISAGPTIGFNVATIKRPNGKKFLIWDVGGQEVLRSYWRHYYRGTSAIVFVVDSTDSQRFLNVKKEIHSLLRESELFGIPVLVLANKQDAQGATDSETLKKALSMEDLTDRKWAVLPASAVKGTGMDACLEWLGTNAIPISKFGDVRIHSDEHHSGVEHQSGIHETEDTPRESQSVGFDSFEEKVFAEHEANSYSSVRRASAYSTSNQSQSMSMSSHSSTPHFPGPPPNVALPPKPR